MDLEKEVVAIVLGGGRGTRLFPLTKVRAKPAVSLGGKYRLVDIPISNCLHSNIDRIYVLTQFLSASLNRHISRTYHFESFGTGFIEILAAREGLETASGGWYEGTADAVRRNLAQFLELPARDYLILAGDQLYRMDLADMIRTHRLHAADITVAVTPIRREEAGAFGIMRLAADGRIVEFVEKPKDPVALDRLALSGLSSGKTHLASMGIYVIRRERLAELVSPTDMQDFGKHVIPKTLDRLRVQSYVFDGYWEDIGTISAYYKAMLALTDPVPPFELFNPVKPIYTRQRFLPPTRAIGKVALDRALVAEGGILRDCSIEHSIVGIRSRVMSGVVVKDSIVFGGDYYENPVRPGEMPEIGEGAVIRGAIIDKNARIGRGARLLNEKGVQEADGEGWHIRDGIICVPKDATIAAGTVV
jgi:glucose-1-phosphate adenylyltransferase